MIRNATDQNQLSDKQLVALKSLLAGMTQSQAAEAADVHRSTINRWLSEDDHFIAARNLARQELRDAQAAKLEVVCDKAVEAVSKAIEGGDARIAMNVLKMTGLLTIQGIGPTTPESVAQNREWNELQQQMINGILN